MAFLVILLRETPQKRAERVLVNIRDSDADSLYPLLSEEEQHVVRSRQILEQLLKTYVHSAYQGACRIAVPDRSREPIQHEASLVLLYDVAPRYPIRVDVTVADGDLVIVDPIVDQLIFLPLLAKFRQPADTNKRQALIRGLTVERAKLEAMGLTGMPMGHPVEFKTWKDLIALWKDKLRMAQARETSG
jgi:hypothetical protein